MCFKYGGRLEEKGMSGPLSLWKYLFFSDFPFHDRMQNLNYWKKYYTYKGTALGQKLKPEQANQV